jgi:transposase-like protein
MSDENCGWPTTSDGECQNPAGDDGTCWIPTHGDDDGENPQGRPSLLKEYEDEIYAAAEEGMTLEGCARIAGIDESTLHRWKNKYEDFRKSLKRARAKGELKHLRSVDNNGSRFILERSFGYVKTEKRELDADVAHSGQIDGERTHGLDDETREVVRDALADRYGVDE